MVSGTNYSQMRPAPIYGASVAFRKLQNYTGQKNHREVTSTDRTCALPPFPSLPRGLGTSNRALPWHRYLDCQLLLLSHLLKGKSLWSSLFFLRLLLLAPTVATESGPSLQPQAWNKFCKSTSAPRQQGEVANCVKRSTILAPSPP